MALRNIVKIDQEKCNGCGQCIDACAEGAIELIDGKAKLVSEVYCDGLGACLGQCPQDAIAIEQRQAAEFDEAATEAHLAAKKPPAKRPFQCPGSMTRIFQQPRPAAPGEPTDTPSQLSHWPVQLMLVSPSAPYFKNADLLLAADCVPFAMPDFHQRFLSGRSLAVGCPKLDDPEIYIDKVAEIIKVAQPKSFTVVHMEVPCCFGMTNIAKKAIAQSGVSIPFLDITVNLQGIVIRTETITA